MAWKWLLFAALVVGATAEDYASNPSVQLFQQYIQINSTTYSDLTPIVEFWKSVAADTGLPINVYEYVEGFPVIVLKWAGTNSSLGSIMLNSHVDVVPANEDDDWTYPPFSGYLDDDGVIWGRGTQDMKSVGIQHIEAIKNLQANNFQPLRDIYVTLMPDEEVGGEHGINPFLASDEFAEMNVALALDEGTSFDLPLIPLFYQDKIPWQITVDCYGEAAHGSTFPATNDTATGKCLNVMKSLLSFRDEEYQKSLTAPITNAGVYTSVNLNKMNAGTANNIIPNLVSLVFDIRLGTTVREDEFEARLNRWIADAGENVTLSYILKEPQSPATLISTANPYWTTVATAATSLNITILPIVPPGSTDARFVRAAGIPAFGFSPMPNTELLLHSVNERLAASTFVTGISIFVKLIESLANIPGDLTSADPSVYIYKTAV